MRYWIFTATSLFFLLFPAETPGQSGEFSIVAHPSSNIANLNKNDLRRIFLARQQFWPSGEKITVVMREPLSESHAQFCRQYLNLFPYQIERVWQQLVFSGQAESPLYLESDLDVITKVLEQPGALGYVTANNVIPEGLKVIPLSEKPQSEGAQ